MFPRSKEDRVLANDLGMVSVSRGSVGKIGYAVPDFFVLGDEDHAITVWYLEPRVPTACETGSGVVEMATTIVRGMVVADSSVPVLALVLRLLPLRMLTVAILWVIACGRHGVNIMLQPSVLVVVLLMSTRPASGEWLELGLRPRLRYFCAILASSLPLAMTPPSLLPLNLS